MTDIPVTPAAGWPFPPSFFLQAAAVLFLGAMGVTFICKGDNADAMLIGTGLIGALSIGRETKPAGQ